MRTQEEERLLRNFRSITDPEDREYHMIDMEATAARQIKKPLLRLVVGGFSKPDGAMPGKISGGAQ